MKRLKRRARAAIALAIAVIRLADRAHWMTPGERLYRRLFFLVIVALGLLALENLTEILKGVP